MGNFIGREAYLKDIIDPFLNKEENALYIYGEGGVGKTALLRRIYERMSPIFSVDLIDFEDKNYHDFQVFFRVLSDSLEQILGRRIFRTFRIADELYGIKSNNNVYQQKRKKRLITEIEHKVKNKLDFLDNLSKHFDEDFVKTASIFKEVLAEGSQRIGDSIPIWKTINTGANAYFETTDFVEKVKLINSNKELKALTILHHSEIQEKLIDFFIDDINSNITKEDNVLLIIDTFEALWKPNEYTEYNFSVFDRWIREIISKTNHVKWIIAGRNYLTHWNKDSKMTGKVNQEILKEFKDKEAREYLNTNGVENEEVINFLSKKSKIPEYLRACAEYYKLLKNPSIEDFEDIPESLNLLMHQLVHIKDYEGNWLKRLCLFPFIDENISAHIQKDCNLQHIDLIKFPFIEEVKENNFKFTPFMKESLIKYVKDSDNILYKQTHESLFNYFNNQIFLIQSDQLLTESKVDLIIIAFNHCKEYMNIRNLIEWFNGMIEHYYIADKISNLAFLIKIDSLITFQWRQSFKAVINELSKEVIDKCNDIELLFEFIKRYADVLDSFQINRLLNKLETIQVELGDSKESVYLTYCKIVLKYALTWENSDHRYASEASDLLEDNKEKMMDFLSVEELISLHFEEMVAADTFGFTFSSYAVENIEAIINLINGYVENDNLNTLTKLKVGLAYFKLGQYRYETIESKRNLNKKDSIYYDKKLIEFNTFHDNYNLNKCHQYLQDGLKVMRDNVDILGAMVYFFEYEYIKFLVGTSFELDFIKLKIEEILDIHRKNLHTEIQYTITKTLVSTFYAYLNYFSSLKPVDKRFRDICNKISFIVFVNEFSSSYVVKFKDVFNESVAVSEFINSTKMNIQDTKSMSPVVFGIRADNLELVKYLAKTGYNLSEELKFKEEESNNYFLDLRNFEMIEFLIENGVSVEEVLKNIEDIDLTHETTPTLNYLLNQINLNRYFNFHYEFISKLISDCIKKKDCKLLSSILNKKGFENLDINLNSALLDSVTTFRIDIVKLLIENGADPCCQDSLGNTPLLMAVSSQHTKFIEGLVNLSTQHLNISNHQGLTPLLQAISNKNNYIIELLLKNGANINQTYIDGKTPIQLAIAYKDKQIIQSLLKYKPDINAGNYDGYSTLILAVINFDVDVVNTILKLNPILDYESNEGLTALHYAIINNKQNVVFELLKKKFDLNKKDLLGNSYLYYAIIRNNYRLTRILVEKGANVNVSNMQNMSLLQAIATISKPDIRIVKLLLERGYKPHKEDLRVLAYNNQRNVLDFLK
ncbi:ankyrin repeat domain-containing protein [Peribacillus butanolivorans]|uniref:ankyrin repeat domain-containing protein n=1 Tax=Peribacillus butanolivorans TaxID=421767 RepID=UPI003D27C3AA